MKKEIDDLEQAYKSCKSKGFIKEKFFDKELVLSLLKMSDIGLTFIKNRLESIHKESPEWTIVFREYYESLRTLVEAYMLIDGFEADNHQCKNAYVCFKHKEIDLDWEFMESIRLKRNRINYRGEFLNFNEWKRYSMNFELHISTLRGKINERLK